jgi:plastocyanin
MTRLFFGIALATLACAVPALAGTVSIAVSSTDGKPAADAVVALVPDVAGPLPASRVPLEAIIDQRHETFIPLVSVIRKGGRVVFTNNDTTMHQVYSFAAIKQFEFEIDQGQHSAPVVFAQSGVAAIGCNIHDQMIAYVYVGDTPWTALTDAKGQARFADVPSGAYHANVWHPRLAPGKPAPSEPVAVSGPDIALAVQISLLAGPPPGMKRMHMGNY